MPIRTVADFDPWLEPYRPGLERQRAYVQQKSRLVLGDKLVADFALGHLYFGLHQENNEWVFREWAPGATAIFLHCEASGWRDEPGFSLKKGENGIWEGHFNPDVLHHEDQYSLHIYWEGGDGERIPSYASYVVQDQKTHHFSAVVWQPAHAYHWKYPVPPAPAHPLIYEAHIGMSGEEPRIHSYTEFTRTVLPRIAGLGYNTVQLMAIQEHPYYGSFGYHVANFFAASSRFGTPTDLKQLIDTAHKLGLRVIMDIVHSHAVKNEVEGLSRFDGSLTQYFHEGDRGNHPAWDSRVFDYGKPEVVHFLLSNVRFWLDEYRFDGFRFDGVTSMLYHHHGLGTAFGSYDAYVGEAVERDALTYLTLANRLIQAVRPDAVRIAEDTSAFPGLAAPYSVGGVGFTHRLSMGVPDLWIKTIKEKRDEDWELGHLFHELTSHRPEEKTISYAESHDQALVGDKTIIFRLIDKDMYDHMQIGDTNIVVERGLALHKMIRLLTASTNAGGYLNFMGNEFGHPEWIDFPRQGNGWSYQYARRQWSLVDNKKLAYHWLNAFDTAMIALVATLTDDEWYHYVAIDQERNLLSYLRSGRLFVFNFSPDTSYTDHEILAAPGQYALVLSSDEGRFGGQDRVDAQLEYGTISDTPATALKLYLPARTALVFERQ